MRLARRPFLPISASKKELQNGFVFADLQYANGAGVDASLQGGAMVNNDVMEDAKSPHEIYLAKLFYHHEFFRDHYLQLKVDIGKMGVNDFFDQGIAVSDQSTQFLNQAVNNNGAFDYAQDLRGHGYTYGAHIGAEKDAWGLDIGLFSSDADLDNVHSKSSLVYGLRWEPKWARDLRIFTKFMGS